MRKSVTLHPIILIPLIMVTAALIYAAWPTLSIVAPWLVIGVLGLVITVMLVFLISLTMRWAYRQAANVSDSKATIANNRVGIELSQLDYQRQTIRLQAEVEVIKRQLQQLDTGLIYAGQIGDSLFNSHSTSAARLAAGTMPQVEQPTVMPDLLSAISSLDNLLIVGGKGSGKTTLMQWLESMRLAQRRRSIVLDSHATPSQWAGDVVGRKRDYSSIKEAMVALVHKMHQRYERRDAGLDDFEPVDQYIDEFTLLPRVLKRDLDFDIQDYSIPVLTEGRKVRYNCVWGIHSDRAEALGLKGAKDIVECFDAIVYLKNVDGERFALVNFGDGVDKETRYRHPGPFVVDGQAATVPSIQPKIQRPPQRGRPVGSIIDMPVAPEPVYDSEIERVTCEAFEQRGSKSAAYRAWYQFVNGEKPSSVGGAQFAASIDPILEKYGLID